MLLYTVKDGGLVTTPVIKETKCYYFINDFNFSWKSRIDKIDAMLTPEQALQEELNHALESFGMRKDHMTRAFRRLKAIRRLKHSFESK